MRSTFSSTIHIGELQVETVLDQQHIVYGENLSGTVYVHDEDSDEEIETLRLEVLSRTAHGDHLVTKQSFDMVGGNLSKGTTMLHFEIVPDERWSAEVEAGAALILRTTAAIASGSEGMDEDSITYTEDE